VALIWIKDVGRERAQPFPRVIGVVRPGGMHVPRAQGPEDMPGCDQWLVLVPLLAGAVLSVVPLLLLVVVLLFPWFVGSGVLAGIWLLLL
jgi:hypothetical protein